MFKFQIPEAVSKCCLFNIIKCYSACKIQAHLIFQLKLQILLFFFALFLHLLEDFVNIEEDMFEVTLLGRKRELEVYDKTSSGDSNNVWTRIRETFRTGDCQAVIVHSQSGFWVSWGQCVVFICLRRRNCVDDASKAGFEPRDLVHECPELLVVKSDNWNETSRSDEVTLSELLRSRKTGNNWEVWIGRRRPAIGCGGGAPLVQRQRPWRHVLATEPM